MAVPFCEVLIAKQAAVTVESKTQLVSLIIGQSNSDVWQEIVQINKT
jgi:hypothetical protein